ncbi:bifunctional oligoribonuclease/PAP phosphatase NrnA [Candidatus Atribacteria bacterium HGW-Atribacteria-1]|nr:MAG: bifunctional oligoribonuclease/PAP phosphatase NrnA [Candidatus Atribacteria bacterium HGW-Atribacteria-1]
MNNFNEINQLLQKNNNFLITSHVNLDGDGIGSELALYFILKKLKKKPIILNQDRLPKIYDFLPGSNKVHYLKDNYIDTKSIDVGIVLDCSNVKRIGKTYEIFKDIKIIINIDHHKSNENFGGLNYVDSSVSSVGEIIYELIKSINIDLLDEKISTCLFAAIITDTGSFRYSNVSSKTFEVASDLTSKGIKPYLIANNIYNRNTYSGLKLLGEALSTLEMDESNYVSWLTITRKMLNDAKAKDEEIEGIIDVATTLNNVEISILFRETKDDKIKISFRSKGNFDVNKFAGKFKGGGHPNAAGCLCSGKLDEIKEKILSELFKEIKFCEE